MEVLVTGGGGFIGSAVIKYLNDRGDNGVVFDRTVGHDVRFASDLNKYSGVHHVIHLAGVLGTHELFDAPYEALDVNVRGTLNVLEFCKMTGAGFTGITMPQVFPSIYTATKIASCALATAYNHTNKVPVSHVRAFNAFGPGQAHGHGHPQKIVPTFAYNAWHGLALPVWGDGSQGVDLISTNDLARMLVDATRFGDNEVFDGGTGEMFTVNEVVDMVGDLVLKNGGPPFSVEHLPMRRGEVPTQIVATGEGWDLLDWRPEFRLSELEEAVNFYRDYTV